MNWQDLIVAGLYGVFAVGVAWLFWWLWRCQRAMDRRERERRAENLREARLQVLRGERCAMALLCDQFGRSYIPEKLLADWEEEAEAIRACARQEVEDA